MNRNSMSFNIIRGTVGGFAGGLALGLTLNFVLASTGPGGTDGAAAHGNHAALSAQRHAGLAAVERENVSWTYAAIPAAQHEPNQRPGLAPGGRRAAGS